MGEMLAAAEADFQPDLAGRRKQVTRIDAGPGKRNGDPGKQGLHQICLTGAQALAPGPAIDVTAGLFRGTAQM